MGSDTGGGISNLTVINCTFTGTQYGLKGKSARDRGGVAQNIYYLQPDPDEHPVSHQLQQLLSG